jgi:phosphatidylinositol glycan class W
MIHDILFFPSANRKRATDAAAQLGPIAPTASTDTWAASTSTSLARPSLSTESSLDAYGFGEAYVQTKGGSGPSRPGSKQGFLTVDDGMSGASESDAGGEHGVSKRRKTQRKSWDGGDVNTKGVRAAHQVERSSKREAVASKEEETLRKTSPELLEGINRNGLVIFLLVRGSRLAGNRLTTPNNQANVLTGLINFGIETIYIPDGTALGILGGYLLVICAFAWTFRATRLLKL